VEVAANHFTQVVVPFALFGPQPVASVAAVIVVVTQCWLVASGNFSWLNAITIVLAFSALDDAALHHVVRVTPPHVLAAPGWHTALSVAVFVVVVVLSYWPVRNLFSRRQRMNSSFDPLRLVNTYGAFGSITRERYEIVIEGTRADDPTTPDAEWHEYEFKGKPGDPARRPPQVAPYHLRLDWLMWFAALSLERQTHWLLPFLAKLLENDAPTLRLLRRNPFPDAPPRFVRAVFYRYAYTSWAERRRTGAWWVRARVATAVPALSLASFGRSGYGAQRAGKNRSSTPESLKPGP
jgi:membrane protein implicated in regulation of membrane protease activity